MQRINLLSVFHGFLSFLAIASIASAAEPSAAAARKSPATADTMPAAVRPPLISDQAFARLVSQPLWAAALSSQNAELLTDLALEMAEAEHVLERPISGGLTATDVLHLARQRATGQKDNAALARLDLAARKYGFEQKRSSNTAASDAMSSEQADVLKKLTAGSRAVNPTPLDYLQGALGGVLKVALISQVGDLEYNWSDGWGHTEKVWNGQTKVVWSGIHSHLEKIYVTRNQGTWQRGTAQFIDSANQINVNFSGLRRMYNAPEFQPGIQFHIAVSGLVRVSGEVRRYDAGIREFDVDGSGRITVTCNADVAIFLSDGGWRLGENVANVRVTSSNVILDHLGVAGGETAKVLGDAITGAGRAWIANKEQTLSSSLQNAFNQVLQHDANTANQLMQLIKDRTLK